MRPVRLQQREPGGEWKEMKSKRYGDENGESLVRSRPLCGIQLLFLSVMWVH